MEGPGTDPGKRRISDGSGGSRGAVAVIVAIMLVVLLSFAALSIDLGHLFVVRNELQNAADSGALAGAQGLYLNSDAGEVNTGANAQAQTAATANKSENLAVEVAAADVQRGHWSFAAKTFTPNDSTAPPDLTQTMAELDADTSFINAVKVTARRESTPAASFFANILGYASFAMNREAVAYIGYAGTLAPDEADQPIAICEQSLMQSGAYSCGIGRMINSGGNSATHNTGGWTNFSQPCTTANVPSVRPLIDHGNPHQVILGTGMGTVGGQLDTVLSQLYDAWKAAVGDPKNGGVPDKPWPMTLPVIDCSGNNVSPCSTVVGAVDVNVIWIQDQNDPHYNKVPRQMTANGTSWNCPPATAGSACWTSFVNKFNLKDASGNPAPYMQKSLYFLPDCTPHEVKGRTGGSDFGVLAKIPVLVE